MVANSITVGVYALDRILVPKRPAGKGWLASLAETPPVLRAGSALCAITLHEGPEGIRLAKAVALSGLAHPEGARVVVEPVPGDAALFLLRISGKPAGLAATSWWLPGRATAGAAAAEDPAALTAFTAGTLIDTPDGARLAEDLAAGDFVTTLANGSRPLRWVGRRRVDAVELLAHPGLRPVAFAPGVAGNRRELRVSARQRMLVDDWRAEVYFGEDRVLVAAQALVDDATVRVVLPAEGLDYVLLLCDRHEVLIAEGALSESFHPGETGLAALTADQRLELDALVPEADLQRRRAAYPIVRSTEARALRIAR